MKTKRYTFKDYRHQNRQKLTKQRKRIRTEYFFDRKEEN